MADTNLVFGVLAVQLGFATPAQVMVAASAWMADKTQSLAERLEQSGALTVERRKLLEGLVEQAVRANGGDAAKTLATVGGGGALFRSFGGSISPNPASGDSPLPLATPQEDDAVTSEQPGHYTIKSEYGRGGQSRVFLAVDEHIGREIALKQLLPEANTSESASATPVGRTTAAAIRFLREARITGRLEHPNIVPVYELGRRADGSHYYTQKLVRGETLRKKLAACNGLADRLRLLGHFLNVCQAMAYAHSRNVIHRDLKPDNVMIGEFGETVVLDWGLAKAKRQPDALAGDEAKAAPALEGHPSVTVEGHALGTPSYMSPEQALGKLDEVDERSDVWSLGAIFYEILTGQPPFTGDTAFDVIGKVIKEPIARVESLSTEAPRELIAICMRALQRDPAGRYPSAKELAAEVEAYQAGGRVAAYQYSNWELLRRFAGRNKLQLVIAVFVALPLAYAGISRVARLRRGMEVKAELMSVDDRLRKLDLLMESSTELPRLLAIEEEYEPLISKAGQLRIVAQDLGVSLPPIDDLEVQIHSVLKRLDSDTYALPPRFVTDTRRALDKMKTHWVDIDKRYWQRRKQYWPQISDAFKRRGLDDAMAELAWRESGFDPFALSGAGARGIWQLMDTTARHYGLQVSDHWRDGGIDERTDPAKSSEVAATILNDMLVEFGTQSQLLAIVCYNTDWEAAREAVVRAAKEPGGWHTGRRDLWRLYRLHYLSADSMERLPSFVATEVIAENPEHFGLN